MKFIIKLFILLLLFSCTKNENQQVNNQEVSSGDYSTIGVLVDINEEFFNDDESVNTFSRYSWSSDDNNRILNGNGIPNHEVGTFPNPDNPNRISEQTVNSRFTLYPSIVSETVPI